MKLKISEEDMPKNYNRQEPIELTCFKMFLRVVARHKHYAMLVFRMPSLFGTAELVMLPAFARVMSKTNDSPFLRCDNVNKLLEILRHETTSMEHMISKSSPLSDIGKEQSHIANVVNCLLHHLVEGGNVGIDELQKMGEEIFNNTCRLIYGEGFKDETLDNPYIPTEEMLTDYLTSMGARDVSREMVLDILEKIQKNMPQKRLEIRKKEMGRPMTTEAPSNSIWGYTDFDDDFEDYDDFPW